ncbi:O-antigen ligase family protein, partial [Blautia sp. HCP3S3_D9]|uniref:O-antigen ligase family protein n=1 Tax=Blautia sp. HCP3S3_D9 TaxID=3438912 RepID=UPI003F8A15DA
INTIEQKLWLVFLGYVLINYLVCSNKQDAGGLVQSLAVYSIFVFIGFSDDFYKRLLSTWNILNFLCVLTVFLSAVFKNFMLGFFDNIMIGVAQDTVIKEMAAGVYSGIFGEKLNAAYAASLGFVFTYSRYLKKPKFKLLILSFYYVVAIFFTGKRISILMLIFMICSSVYINNKDKHYLHKSKKYILSAILLFVVVIIALPEVRASMGKIIGLFQNDGSTDITSSRSTLLWPVGISMFMRNPLLGSGLCSYNRNMRYYYRDSSSVLANWSTNAHNIYLQTLAELGLVGACILYSCFIYNMIHTVKLYRKIEDIDDKQLCLISLGIQMVFLLVGITENTFYTAAQLATYLIAIGIQVAMNRKYSGERKLNLQ